MQATVTKQQVAERYQVAVRTVTNWMRERRISFLKIGRVVRFDLNLVDSELRKAGLVRAE